MEIELRRERAQSTGRRLHLATVTTANGAAMKVVRAAV